MSHRDNNPDPELYELIFENSVNAILLTSPKGEILKTNTCFKEIFGYLDDEILHKKLNTILLLFLICIRLINRILYNICIKFSL
ncbi:PAS domain S-box protein [Methanobacterium alcaliphilum]|uniref:PAS domain S-box protein n=1 Tax=Methanobacterium alcaliphilum TaxID=392018 RepID=UPI003CCB7403